MTFETLTGIPSEEKEEFFSTQSSHAILKNTLNFKENWEEWERVKSQYPTSRYLFFRRKSPSFSSDEEAVFLVNIIATADILQKYYSLFRKEIGFDFSVVNTVFEIEDNNSLFWEKVLNQHDLLGILLGFGETNAVLYDWVRKNENAVEENQQKRAFYNSLSTQSPGSNTLASLTDIHFPLPAFACYAEPQSLKLIKKYEMQRKMIQKIYKGKNLVEITLKHLTSQDLPIDPDAKYRQLIEKKLFSMND